MNQAPADAAVRRAAKPLVCYQVEQLPPSNRDLYRQAREGMKKVSGLTVPPRDGRCFEVPAGSFRLEYRVGFARQTPLGGEAGFEIHVGGELVDAVSGADVSGNEWVTRSVELPEQQGGQVTIEVTVVTKSSGTYFQSAEAWIDAIRIG